MVSEKQLNANRENGKLGGVRSEAGKAISSKNAMTHGILSKQVVVPGEITREFNKLWSDLMAYYEPQGAVESMLVDIIATSYWRWHRIVMIETDTFDFDWSESSRGPVHRIDSMQNVARYETTIERRMYKAMHELERLQRTRSGENLPAPLAIDVNLAQPD